MRLDPKRASLGREPARQRGFTLIEVMIVVTIVALLATVALPSYQNSVRKARRADARSALATTAQLLERYSTEKGSSGYSTATINSTAGLTVIAKPATDNGYYTLSFTSLSATAFTLRAAPVGGQTADGCGSFTLDERGVRGVAGGTLAVTDCW